MQPNLRLQPGFPAARQPSSSRSSAARSASTRRCRRRGSRRFYRAVVTATLAGLDTVPANDGARIVSIVLVLAGLTIIAYAGAVIVEAIAGGVLTGVLAERRRGRTIERLSDHFIICGYGRVGRRVAEEFRAAGVPYVVLDFSEDAIAAAKEHGDLLIEGNATEDEDLAARRASTRARASSSPSDDDADNLYISLSARHVRPDIQIVARASDEDAEKKLQLAGADRVVMPYTAAGPHDGEPRPEAAGDCRSSTPSRPPTGPDLHMAEIEVTTTLRERGQDDPRDPRAPRDRRDHRRAAEARRHVRHDAGARRRDRAGRRASSASARPRSCNARGSLRARRGRWRLIPSRALAGAHRRRRHARAAERSRARRLRDERRAAARRRAPAGAARARGGARRGGAGAARGRARRGRGPGLRQPLPRRTRGSRDALGAMLDAGYGVRRRLGRSRAARARRDGVGEPDRADHGRVGAERRVRRLRRAAARVRGPRRRARVLLQRRGRADGPLPRVGRGGAARGGAAGGRLPRRVHRGARARATAIRSPRCCKQIEDVARAVPHPLRLVGEPERRSRSASPSCCRGSTRTRPTARSGRARPRSATTRIARSSARPTARSSTSPPTSRTCSDKLERGFDTAIYVLGADHHGYVARLKAAAAMLGYDPDARRGAASTSSCI